MSQRNILRNLIMFKILSRYILPSLKGFCPQNQTKWGKLFIASLSNSQVDSSTLEFHKNTFTSTTNLL